MSDYFVLVDYVITCGIWVPVSAQTPEEAEEIAVREVQDATFLLEICLPCGTTLFDQIDCCYIDQIESCEVCLASEADPFMREQMAKYCYPTPEGYQSQDNE